MIVNISVTCWHTVQFLGAHGAWFSMSKYKKHQKNNIPWLSLYCLMAWTRIYLQITHSTGHWPSLHGAVMTWACNRWDDETQPPVDMDHFLCLPGRCWKGYTKTMKAKKFASGETDMFLVDVSCQTLSWNWCCHTKRGLLQSKVFYISIHPATFREQLELGMMQFPVN